MKRWLNTYLRGNWKIFQLLRIYFGWWPCEGTLRGSCFWESNDIPDRTSPGQQHNQSVQTKSYASCICFIYNNNHQLLSILRNNWCTACLHTSVRIKIRQLNCNLILDVTFIECFQFSDNGEVIFIISTYIYILFLHIYASSLLPV